MSVHMLPTSLLAVVLLCAGTLAAAAQTPVPHLDVRPTCNNIDGSVGPTQRTPADCFKAEDAAKAELAKVWDQYSAPDRSLCTDTARMGGIPSYVQLLTCLELRRDARNLPPDKLMRTEDASAKQ